MCLSLFCVNALTNSLRQNLFDSILLSFHLLAQTRELEEKTVYSFELFLRDVEGGEIECLTLEDLIVFVTGADTIPPLGFDDKIRAKFAKIGMGINLSFGTVST